MLDEWCGCILLIFTPLLLLTWPPLRCLVRPWLLSSSPAERGSTETSEQQATARKIGNCRGGCFLPASQRLLRSAPSVDTLLGSAERYLFAFPEGFPFFFWDVVATPQLHFLREAACGSTFGLGQCSGGSGGSSSTRHCTARLGLAKHVWTLENTPNTLHSR